MEVRALQFLVMAEELLHPLGHEVERSALGSLEANLEELAEVVEDAPLVGVLVVDSPGLKCFD